MDIVGPVPDSSTITLTSSPVPTWRVGQRLEAQVTKLIGLGKVTLQVDLAIVEARTYLAVAIGQHLRLEVISSGSQVVLRLTPPTPESTSIKAALCEALPTQQPLQTVFSQITTLLSSTSGLSPTTVTLLKQLIGQLPNLQTILRIDGFKQAIMDTGLFFERKLGNNHKPASWASDLKANLLRLHAESCLGRDESAKTLTPTSKRAWRAFNYINYQP